MAFALLHFLTQAIAASGVEDVRDVLDYYNKETDPLEAFKINQVKLQVTIRFFFNLMLSNKT